MNHEIQFFLEENRGKGQLPCTFETDNCGFATIDTNTVQWFRKCGPGSHIQRVLLPVDLNSFEGRFLFVCYPFIWKDNTSLVFKILNKINLKLKTVILWPDTSSANIYCNDEFGSIIILLWNVKLTCSCFIPPISMMNFE